MRMNQLIRGALLSASLLLSACERASPVDPFGTGDAPARPREETSILGVWSLQTVHIEGQLRDSSPPLSNVVNVKPGANGTMYTKDHKALQLYYGNTGNERTYRAFADSLIVFDSITVDRERILDLTPTRLVTVMVTDKPEGHFTIITTFKRTSLEELENLRLRDLSSEQ